MNEAENGTDRNQHSPIYHVKVHQFRIRSPELAIEDGLKLWARHFPTGGVAGSRRSPCVIRTALKLIYVSARSCTSTRHTYLGNVERLARVGFYGYKLLMRSIMRNKGTKPW
jgi:hypothetical protein